ncbi:MAG: carbohydrate-binding protein, partial [Actinocrinis sp.]
MSRARLAVVAVGAVTVLLSAAFGIGALASGHGAVTGPPQVAGMPLVGTASGATTTASGAAAVRTTTPATAPVIAPPTRPGSSSRAGAASAWPNHVLAGYWQDFVNHAAPLPLAAIPRGYNLVDVAFAAADTAHDGGVTFKLSPALSRALGGYTTAQFTADIATLH